MNNTFVSRSTSRAARRAKAPGEPELHALFQLMSAPALLVDNLKEQVVLANSPFLQLTAFSMNEINGRAIQSLLSGLPSHPLGADEVLSVILERRNRTPLPVNMQVRALDTAGNWLALLFEPQEDKRKMLTARIDQMVQLMIDLSRLPENETTRQTLERGLELVQKMMDVSMAAIYRVEQGDAQIWKAAEVGEPGVLPDVLPPADLLRLSQTFVWRPGRRVQTELHRSARVQNLTFLASTPISQNGLLVLADRAQEPPDYMQMAIEGLGKQFSGIMDRVVQMGGLRRQALENRRELSVWRSVGENAQEGILLLAGDLTVREMNPAAEWMLGYADWEVKGQPVENILIGPERLAPALELAVDGMPTHNMGSVSLHRRTGQSFPAHIQIIPVEREGEILSILVFFSDVSEKEESHNRTQQLEQRAVLGEVTAVFAHEVRNPINNISTGLQLLSVKLPPDDPNQDNINRLIGDCTRLNHLMESVLSFSRYVEHKLEPVDLEPLMRRILDRWRPRFAKVNVIPHFQVEPNTPLAMVDPRSIEQVFTNLISNAVEAMGTAKDGEVPGGTLAVRIAPFSIVPGRPQVEVTVSDTGPGIPEDIRERIFEPFVTTKSTGTGLGLAITKRIVTAHHGSINVSSFPGGTVFHVFLSAQQGEAS